MNQPVLPVFSSGASLGAFYPSLRPRVPAGRRLSDSSSLGIHPDHLASLRYIIQSGAGLAIGAAIAATGLLGLAEKYQHTVSRIGPLLKRKFLGDKLHLGVRSADELQAQNRHFWQAYRNAGFSLALFMAGLLAISMLLNQSSFSLYIAGLGIGIAVLGTMSGLLGIKGLMVARRLQQRAEKAAALLDAQPDQHDEESILHPSAPPRVVWASNRHRTTTRSQSQSLVRRSLSVPR